MTKPLIVANWKMNPVSLAEAKHNFKLIKKGTRKIRNVETVICAPFVFLSALKPGKNIKIGAQDCFREEKGAFTGEISPKQLVDLGCQYVILGHSERRKYQKETNEMITEKLKAALKVGLKPILCVDKISQIPKNVKNTIIAYEPLFAIGTGRACNHQKAKKMRMAINKVAGKTPFLYGGSVNSQNAKNYIEEAGFQGLLVGGASLKPKEFIDIINKVCC